MMERARALLLGGACWLLLGCTNLLGDFSIGHHADAPVEQSGGQAGMPATAPADSTEFVLTGTDELVTSERGTRASFGVALRHAPTAPVDIDLSSSNTAEGTVAPALLHFTPDNYAAPQRVEVTGVDDAAADGPQHYAAVLGLARSDDPSYFGQNPPDPDVLNVDDDSPGFTWLPGRARITAESGDEAELALQLNQAPTADVLVMLSSSDPAEGTVRPASLTFTPQNWMAPRTVRVTGVDDAVQDGPRSYRVVTSNAESADPAYGGFDVPDIELQNLDDETPGIVWDDSSGLFTGENGKAQGLGVRLAAPPSANVEVSLQVSDATEAVLGPSRLVFAPQNWLSRQLVQVRGVDDTVADGNQPFQVVATVSSSSDARYAALAPASATLGNVDDDSPGFSLIGAKQVVTGETAAPATFGVVLDAKPTGEVVLDVQSSRADEATVIPAELRFTADNWNAPQTVHVVGKDDALADGTQAFVVRVQPAQGTTDPAFAALLGRDVAIRNIDDETPAVRLELGGPQNTSESGGSVGYGIALEAAPRADVFVDLASSAPEGSVSPRRLIFTRDNFAALQTVTVRGADDDAADGDRLYRVLGGVLTSSDPQYNGLDVPSVAVTNLDDDTAAVDVVTDAPLVTTEAGGWAQFTVALRRAPTADVTFDLSSSNLSEGTVKPSSLRFTSANWRAPQVVTVVGKNDGSPVADGAVPYWVQFSTLSSDDPAYSGAQLTPADVLLQNLDDDSPGIRVLAPKVLTTSERDPAYASFQVLLTSRPASKVSFDLASSRADEAKVYPSSVTFSPDDWAAPRMLRLTGVDDHLPDGAQPYFVSFSPAVSDDAGYAGLLPEGGVVSARNLDDDSAGIRVNADSRLVALEPDGTAMFTVQLTSAPTDEVTLPLAVSDLDQASVSPAMLRFTPQNWRSPHAVTVSAIDDIVLDGAQPCRVLLGPAISSDERYSQLQVPDVSTLIGDDDAPGIAVTPISGNTKEEGGVVATFTLALQTRPTADVTIQLGSSNTAEGHVTPASVTFTPLDWASPQEISVTGVDDQLPDGAQPYWIEIAPAISSDPAYAGLDADDVTLVNYDNDTPNVQMSRFATPTSESGDSVDVSIVLSTRPTAKVTLQLASSDETEGVVSARSVTFTPDDWASYHTVRVTGVEDDGAPDGDQPYAIVFEPLTSDDPGYAGLEPRGLPMLNRDNDSAAVLLSAERGGTSEDGGAFSFGLRLIKKPKANVQIAVKSSNPNEGIASPALLTFTPLDWAAEHDVKVTGVDDAVRDGSVLYRVLLGAPSSKDADYAALGPRSVTVVNRDDESPGVLVSPAGGGTSESGASTTFTIQLQSAPKADVTIELASSAPGEGAVTPSKVVLTPSNWKKPHTVTIQGQDDTVADGAQVYRIVTSDAQSDDPDYDGLNVDDVTLVNRDDDTPGFLVGAPDRHTSENGTIASFAVSLTSKPRASVTIPLSVDDPNEAELETTSVTFTAQNWNLPQTVTVRGVDDDVLDGAARYQVVLGSATSQDAAYAGLDAPDVALVNDDNEGPAIRLNLPGQHATYETPGAPLFTFTVALGAAPVAPVTIGLSSSNEGEGIVVVPSSKQLRFDATNWKTPQQVSVAGVDDHVADGNVSYWVVLGSPQSADTDYAALAPQSVDLVNVDNELP